MKKQTIVYRAHKHDIVSIGFLLEDGPAFATRAWFSNNSFWKAQIAELKRQLDAKGALPRIKCSL